VAQPVAVIVTVRSPEAPTRPYVVRLTGDEARIGRGAACELQLPSAGVSSVHARLRRTSEGLFLEDLGSRNGTTIAGRRLAASSPTRVSPADVIDVGGYLLAVRLETESGEAGIEAMGDTADLARRLALEALAALPGADRAPALVVERGFDLGARFVLPPAPGTATIGRAPSCEVRLNDPDVSREHARVVRDAHATRVEDLTSKNGIELNGERVVGEARLRDGDLLRVGATALRLVDPVEAFLAALENQPDGPETPLSQPMPQPSGPPLDQPSQRSSGQPSGEPPVRSQPAAPVVPPAVSAVPKPRASSAGLAWIYVLGCVLALVSLAAIFLLVRGG
jgi:pSer/pThr/pTyr-binding forkhead associated (FHA) protein